jgi:hypothetical protein
MVPLSLRINPHESPRLASDIVPFWMRLISNVDPAFMEYYLAIFKKSSSSSPQTFFSYSEIYCS